MMLEFTANDAKGFRDLSIVLISFLLGYTLVPNSISHDGWQVYYFISRVVIFFTVVLSYFQLSGKTISLGKRGIIIQELELEYIPPFRISILKLAYIILAIIYNPFKSLISFKGGWVVYIPTIAFLCLIMFKEKKS